jgi:hypothetical protein
MMRVIVYKKCRHVHTKHPLQGIRGETVGQFTSRAFPGQRWEGFRDAEHRIGLRPDEPVPAILHLAPIVASTASAAAVEAPKTAAPIGRGEEGSSAVQQQGCRHHQQLGSAGGVKHARKALVIGVPKGSPSSGSKIYAQYYDRYMELLRQAQQSGATLYMTSPDTEHVDSATHFKYSNFVEDKTAAGSLRARGVSGVGLVVVEPSSQVERVKPMHLVDALLRLVDAGVVNVDAWFKAPSSQALANQVRQRGFEVVDHPALFHPWGPLAAVREGVSMVFRLPVLLGTSPLDARERSQGSLGRVPPPFYTQPVRGKGSGLFCAKLIPEGAYIGEYLGEVISDQEAERRLDNKYMFDVMPEEPGDGGGASRSSSPGSKRKRADVLHVIDAQNPATSSFVRYINTDLDAGKNNATFRQERLGIFLVARQRIPAHTEITAHYGKDTRRILSMRGGSGRRDQGLTYTVTHSSDSAVGGGMVSCRQCGGKL